MFQETEKDYKKQLKENKFNKFYRMSATILIALTAKFKKIFINICYIIYIILGSSLGIIIVIISFLVPILIIKSIINSIIFSKEKLHSNISEDLTYILFNFNKYKNQINK